MLMGETQQLRHFTPHVRTPRGATESPHHPEPLLQMLRLCLVEARISVQCMFLIRLLALAALAGVTTSGTGLLRFAAGAISWVAATTFTYLYNGVADADKDWLNHSTRPIARGALGTERAMQAALGCAALALVAAGCVDPRLVGATVGLLALGYAYSAPRLALKSTSSGAMTVVLLSGMLTYYAGSVIADGDLDAAALPVFALAMSLWPALVGALVKDFSDVSGDAAAGRRTWAIVLGEGRTSVLAAVHALLIGAGFAVAAARWAPALLPAALVTLLGACAVAISLALLPADGSRDRRRLPYRVFMVTQYLAHLTALASAMIWPSSATG
ncbi:UbiA family prenyltransferase [Streptomyces sp. NBC_00454]|uniref:UbiA family prenyltransferase n=1 Tax=Streptomyces sp. NBC_00454 TaxID=2975747 RepID=UPI0030DF5FCD